MAIEKINNSINYLITNSFLGHGINCKIYVCHYIFCSYVLTKNSKFLEFALDILKETLKVAYLNKKRKIDEFNDAVNYCICISISLGIELEIDELIDDIHNQPSMQIFRIHNENLLDSNGDLIKWSLYKKNLPLLVLLHIRKNEINQKNYMKYIKMFYNKYSLDNIKEYLVCISLISYFFKKEDVMNDVVNKLAQRRLRNVYKQVIDLIVTRKENCFSIINTDITTIMGNIENELNVDLGLIYYFLIDEKAKRCFGQLPRH